MIAVRLPGGMRVVILLRIVFCRDICWVDVAAPFPDKTFALSNRVRAERTCILRFLTTIVAGSTTRNDKLVLSIGVFCSFVV